MRGDVQREKHHGRKLLADLGAGIAASRAPAGGPASTVGGSAKQSGCKLTRRLGLQILREALTCGFAAAAHNPNTKGERERERERERQTETEREVERERERERDRDRETERQEGENEEGE